MKVGDMFDMMTNGRFKSVPHRVQSPSPGSSRISFPFFFDFSWDAHMFHLPLEHLPPLTQQQEDEARVRWANTNFTGVCEHISDCLREFLLTQLAGIWALYLAKKVKKVFPGLELPDFEHNSKPSTRFTVEVNT